LKQFKNNTGMKAIERHVQTGKSDSATKNQLSNYISADRFKIGDVYLFNKTDPKCQGDSSLWGVFDKCDGETVYLESSSRDREKFDIWCRLPEDYRYCRLAARTEMRQYIFDQTFNESRRMLGAER